MLAHFPHSWKLRRKLSQIVFSEVVPAIVRRLLPEFPLSQRAGRLLRNTPGVGGGGDKHEGARVFWRDAERRVFRPAHGFDYPIVFCRRLAVRWPSHSAAGQACCSAGSGANSAWMHLLMTLICCSTCSFLKRRLVHIPEGLLMTRFLPNYRN